MLHSDSTFKIGAAKVVCEDYARSSEGVAFLSDGCTSGRDTDIGARLLTLAALNRAGRLAAEGSPADVVDAATDEAVRALSQLRLSPSAAWCTLLGVWMSGGRINALVAGDGLVIALPRAGGAEIILVSCGGRPYYPAYRHDPAAARKAADGEFDSAERRIVILPDGLCVSDGPADAPVFMPRRVYHFDPNAYRAVAVASDGALTFRAVERVGGAARKTPIEVAEVVREVFLGPPSRPELFLSAGLAGAIARLATRYGEVEHADDLSLAGIILD